MSNGVKVSVLVPVYNVSKYLRQCIDSILAQSLYDIEIICIDDGSTDESGSILDEYAKKDSRIKVVHKENGGYGAAMNTGLDIANGEYIGIVESDDYIEKTMYETLYNMAELNCLDLVKSDAYYWMEKAGYLKRIHFDNMEPFYDIVIEDIDRSRYFEFFMNIWTGIYRRDFLKSFDIRFNESLGASYQDNGFWIQTMTYCKRGMWLNKAFYWYRQDNPEASVKSPGKIMAMSNEYEWTAKRFIDRGEYGNLAYCYAYKMLRQRGTFYRIADEKKREYCEHLRSEYEKYKGFIRKDAWLDGWYSDLLKRTDDICYGIINTKKEIINSIDKATNIVIYGAGIRGDFTYRVLSNEGYYDKIACFAVSKDIKEEKIAGKDVLLIDDAVRNNPDAVVILAVIRGTASYNAMKSKLIELGVNNIVDGTDIEENFYIL